MISGTCNYGSEKCWFNHNEFKNTSKNENNENEVNANEAVIEKLFQMMENLYNNCEYERDKLP